MSDVPEMNEAAPEATDAELDAIASGEEFEAAPAEPEAPEVTEEPAPEPEAPKPEEKLVPLAALHEARVNNRQMREQMQAMEKRFQDIMGRLAPPENQLPALEEDPVSHFQQRINQLESLIQQGQQQTQEQQQYQQIVGTYQQQAEQFKKQEPAFQDAYSFLTNGRAQQYMDAGYSQQEANAMVQREELNVVNTALQMGLNPAAMIYNMAQTYGFKPAAPAPAQQQPQPNLETVAKGMKANKSLASAPGKPVDNVTLESIASMSDEDFNKYWDTAIAKS